MNRNLALFLSVVMMSIAAIVGFSVKYYKRPVYTDPMAQRLLVIQGITSNKVKEAAIERIGLDNDIILDSLYQRILRDTVFLNKLRGTYE